MCGVQVTPPRVLSTPERPIDGYLKCAGTETHAWHTHCLLAGDTGGRRPLGAARGAGGRGAMKLGANKLSQPKPEPDFSEW